MILLRPAVLEDSETILGWRNEKTTYKYFRTPSPVTQRTHDHWMGIRLTDPNHRLQIAEKEGERIGLVRYDERDEGCEIGLTMAPKFRGQGLGYIVLNMATINAEIPLNAYIKPENIASVRVFERCHFFALGGDGVFVLYRREPL